MRKTILIALLLTALSLGGQYPEGRDLLRKVDDNMYSDSIISTSTMIIAARRGSKSMKIKSWVQGDDRSFSEYLSPPKDAGTKMLKLEDDLWIYDPAADRSVQISGHLLRQSVMGSDLSYEDLMEEYKLYDVYEAEVVAEELFNDRECWVLELHAVDADLAYARRRMWIDQKMFLPLKEERFGKSGKLLKRTVIEKTRQLDERWYPVEIHFKDMLKSGEGTRLIFDEIQFNVKIPEFRFSKAALRK